jgi:hypothetical protein
MEAFMWWTIALSGLGIVIIIFLIQAYHIAFVEQDDR